MGFFDKVKELAIKAKCMAGFHGGEFTHITGKPECHLGKICPDCKEHITSFKHSFTDWEYLSSDKCEMRCECILCSEQEFKTKHEYREDRIDSSCRVIEKCQRCDHEYIGSTRHTWEFSSYKGQVYRTCKRCGKHERKP